MIINFEEEEFEYGNPKAEKNINIHLDEDAKSRIAAMHWWRKEISRRGYGAFYDMKAIIVASKKDSLVRIIEAGGGMVLNVE